MQQIIEITETTPEQKHKPCIRLLEANANARPSARSEGENRTQEQRRKAEACMCSALKTDSPPHRRRGCAEERRASASQGTTAIRVVCRHDCNSGELNQTNST